MFTLEFCSILIQLTDLQNSERHRVSVIKTQHAATSTRPVFDPKMISVTVIMERNIPAFGVLHTDLNDVWVYDGDDTMTLYDEQLVEKKTRSKLSNLHDMVLTASQDIIATDVGNKRVIIKSPAGNVNTLCSTAPLKPWGICINNRGQIVVALSFEKMLAIYSSDGLKVLHAIKKDKDGKPLFRRLITQVKQNGMGDYVVSDENRIVCVSREGRFKWDYSEGLSSVWGLVCDRHDNIIIADFFNNKILRLSSEGKLVITLLTAEDGISRPRSLSIDRHGQLWIGQSGSLKVVRYPK